ncbi:MAG: ABC transporter permease, partial [Gammaproteobacteria bacterium]
MNGLTWLSGLVTEARSVMRGLVHKPGYPIAAWVMLGLAVAANAAVFAIVWGFLLKPLPYVQPNQLSVVRERLPEIGINYPLVTVKDYLALKQGLRGIANTGLAAGPDGAPVKIAGHTRLLGFEQMTPSLFRTLGVQPILGRLPTANAGQPGGPPEAVISWRLWQSAYGGKRNVLDRTLKVNQKTYRIVGVMQRNFLSKVGGVDAWLPYVITPSRAQSSDLNYWMVVRRKPGVSPHQLNLELQSQRDRLLAKTTPEKRARVVAEGFTVDARPLHAVELSYLGFRELPWLLQAAAGLLLLLALANTVNLGLVRQRARQHEFALRSVLGASRGGLLRLILIEHLPIALAVGITAMLLAWAGISTLHAFGLPGSFSPFQITLAPAVIAFTWILAALAILVVTLGPAFLASGKKLLGTLGHGPTASGGKGARRVQRMLGTVQIALACALVIAGGLLSISLWRVLSQPLGFATQHRIEATVILPHHVKKSDAWTALEPQLRKLPRISSVAATDMIPFSQVGRDVGSVTPAGAGKTARPVPVEIPSVSAKFFATMGIEFLAGRPFSPEEIQNQSPVAVVNASVAKRFFGSVNGAMGKELSLGKPVRIIGVTRDVTWQPMPDQYNPGTVYVPWGSNQAGLLIVVAKTRGPSAPLAGSFKKQIERALPGSAVMRVTTMPNQVKGASVFRAAGAGMVGAFAALALLLAALGVFAITAFIARARLGEYGIRAALGAGPAALLRLGFREAGWLLAIGLPIGLAGAYLLGRVIA